MTAFESYQKVTGILENVAVGIAAGALGLDLIMVSAGLLSRPFGASFSFSQELPRLMQSFLAFLVVAALLKSGGHVAVDILTIKASGKQLAVYELIAFVSTTVAALVLLASSIDALGASRAFGEQSETEYRIPVWYIYTSQVVGFALLSLASIGLAIDRIVFLKTGVHLRRDAPSPSHAG